MARRSKAAPSSLDLYDYVAPEPARLPRAARPDVSIRITDDWPDMAPVTNREVRAIEAFFADVLDELFGPLP